MRPLKSFKKINIFTVVFLLLIGITIGGYLVLKSKIGIASINEQLSKILEMDKQPVAGCQPNPNDKNKDSDNDGLMDWQEITWQTDACKPDTDGDGYLDGEEVSAGYNPIKPAPDDKLPDRESIEPRPLPNNLTRALAQSLTRKIMEGDMGLITNALDPSSISTSNQIVNEAIQETIIKAMLDFSLPNIPDNEIIISSDNSRAAIQNYSKEVVETMNKIEEEIFRGQRKTLESESQLFYYAIQNKDFTEIDKYIELYKKASESIKQIPVPSDLIDIHKEEIGIFWVMSNIYQAVREIDIDPLKTNLALEQYKNVSESINQMLLKLAERAQKAQ
jgi:hypothetical protein